MPFVPGSESGLKKKELFFKKIFFNHCLIVAVGGIV